MKDGRPALEVQIGEAKTRESAIWRKTPRKLIVSPMYELLLDLKLDDMYLKTIVIGKRLEVLLETSKGQITVTFLDYQFVSTIDESYALRRNEEVAKGSVHRGIIKKRESHLLKWFHEESYGIYQDDPPISHFSIMTSNEYIDVLSSDDPVIVLPPH